LLPTNDPEALARSLMRLGKGGGLGRTLVEAAREHAKRHARLEIMVERYAALYEKVLMAGRLGHVRDRG
jgi:glycosyltransferase involved in cell wall biosynthesis